MVVAKVLKAAYGLVHLEWSDTLIQKDLKKRHQVTVHFLFKITFLTSNEVFDNCQAKKEEEKKFS